MIDHEAGHLALRTQLVAISGLPSARAWENKDFTPTAGTPYIADQYVPATHRLLTTMAQGGSAVETGLYVIQWFGLKGSGISAIRTGAAAILAAFAPGSSFATTAGDTIRVRTDTAPVPGQILPLDKGWAVCTTKIPWQAYSHNVVAT